MAGRGQVEMRSVAEHARDSPLAPLAPCDDLSRACAYFAIAYHHMHKI